MCGQSILGKIAPDTRIYRIFRKDRFFQLFETGKNALVHPTRWDDPFENVFLESPVKLNGGEYGSFDFHNAVYGQCWTLERASDAMWQIYSKKENAIRVRTTVRKFIDSLRAVHGDLADRKCFIGRVKYGKVKDLREFGRNMFVCHSGTEAIARSLLIKRDAYKHENEVRLVCIGPDETEITNDVYEFELDPLSVIDQAMVDGRVSSGEFVDLKRQIVGLTGLSKQRIHRSVLYDPPRNFVVHGPRPGG